MKHYTQSEQEQQARTYYRCPRPCYNVTFSTLAASNTRQTEVQTCTCCGRKIEFSTVAMPKKISNPISRRNWGSRTPILSDAFRNATKNWQNLPEDIQEFMRLEAQ